MLARGQDRALFADFYDEATRKGALWYLPDSRLRTPPLRPSGSAPARSATSAGGAPADIDNFRAALTDWSWQCGEAFMPVAAPASVEPGRLNEHYPSEEAYVFALADALKVEYETIVAARLSCSRSTMPGSRRCGSGCCRRRTSSSPPLLRAADRGAHHALSGHPRRTASATTSAGAAGTGPHATDIPLREIVQ